MACSSPSSLTNLELVPLITTDGFAFYAKVIRRVFGPACLYGLVIKTRRNDRIVKVERRVVIGAEWRLEKILADSEDSKAISDASEMSMPTKMSGDSRHYFAWSVAALLCLVMGLLKPYQIHDRLDNSTRRRNFSIT